MEKKLSNFFYFNILRPTKRKDISTYQVPSCEQNEHFANALRARKSKIPKVLQTDAKRKKKSIVLILSFVTVERLKCKSR